MSADRKVQVQVIIPGLASPTVVATPIESQPTHATSPSSKAETSSNPVDKMDSKVSKSIETDPEVLRVGKQVNQNPNLDSRSIRSSTQEPKQTSPPPQPLFAPPRVDPPFREQGLRSETFPYAVDQRIMVSASSDPSSVPAGYGAGKATLRAPSFEPPTVPVREKDSQRAKEPAKKRRKLDMTLSLPSNPLLQSQPSTTTPLVPQKSVASTSNPASGNRRVKSVKKVLLVAPPQPPWYEGYQLTGTANDIPYLEKTWMKIEDADVLCFLRRFHRYVRGSGDSAIASPESTDSAAALDGVMAILTKWQSVHQTRLDITIKDCQLNGVHVGERICDQAFKAGHHSILQAVANYFDTMVRSCEKEFRAMTLSEQEDYQQYGHQSWLGCLKMDYNFFMTARDRIVELCRAEVHRRNSERHLHRQPSGPQAYGGSGIADMKGSSSKSTPGGYQSYNGNGMIGTHRNPPSTPVGKPRKPPWNKGIANTGEFPNVISSDRRYIPPQQAGPSKRMTPDGGATLNGSAMDIDCPVPTAPTPQTPLKQSLNVQVQPQRITTIPAGSNYQVAPTQPQVMQSKFMASTSTVPSFQSVPVQISVAQTQPRIQTPSLAIPNPQAPHFQQAVINSQVMTASGSYAMFVPTSLASNIPRAQQRQPTVTNDRPGVDNSGFYRTF